MAPVAPGSQRPKLSRSDLQARHRNNRALDLLFVERDASAPCLLRREVQEPYAIEALFVGLGRLDDLQRLTLGSCHAGGGVSRFHGRGLGVESAELNAPMLAGRLGVLLVYERRRLRLAQGR